MLYLKAEKVMFAKVKAMFQEQYEELLTRMLDTVKEKGKTRDVNTPIHHRSSPEALATMAELKVSRVKSLCGDHELDRSPALLRRLVEESVDLANYALFIGSTAAMILKEKEMKR